MTLRHNPPSPFSRLTAYGVFLPISPAFAYLSASNTPGTACLLESPSYKLRTWASYFPPFVAGIKVDQLLGNKNHDAVQINCSSETREIQKKCNQFPSQKNSIKI